MGEVAVRGHLGAGVIQKSDASGLALLVAGDERQVSGL